MISFDKFRGCLLGLAIGDALGAPGEFMSDIPIIVDMIQNPRRNVTTWHMD